MEAQNYKIVVKDLPIVAGQFIHEVIQVQRKNTSTNKWIVV